MTTLITESSYGISNPLDMVEQVMMDKDMPFDRPSEDEVVAETSGLWCNYRIWYAWQSEHEALTFSCTLDGKLPAAARTKVYPLLSMVNEKLWCGHFEINSDDGAVCFRHSVLLKGGITASAELLEELLSLALSECERFYPAFQAVVWAGKPVKEAMEAALFDTVGEA